MSDREVRQNNKGMNWLETTHGRCEWINKLTEKVCDPTFTLFSVPKQNIHRGRVPSVYKQLIYLVNTNRITLTNLTPSLHIKPISHIKELSIRRVRR